MDPKNAPSPQTTDSTVTPSTPEPTPPQPDPVESAKQAQKQAQASAQKPAQQSAVQKPAANTETTEAVQQARTSITALQSLFDDPVTLKPREDSDALADAMLTTPRRSEPSPQVAQAKIARALEDAEAATQNASKGSSSGESAKAKPHVADEDADESKADKASAQSQADSKTDTGSDTSTDTSTEGTEANADPKAKPAAKPATLSPDQQVRIKRHEDHLTLIFPPAQKIANPDVTVDFVDSELWQQLQQRLSGGERSWQINTPVHLNAQNHLLDSRQLQEMGEALDRYDLKLTRVATSRRQTAVAAATAGFSIDQGADLPLVSLTGEEEKAKDRSLAVEPLYLQTTVRSGAEIRHPGSVIIMGDLNPGSSVVANGDILVWGRLRGVAHAGAAGNRSSIILALKMEPTQLRIAEALARVPEAAPGPMIPEVAYVTAKNDIRITEAASFTRPR